MQSKTLTPWLFLLLGITQAAHSVEEVMTGLWRNMAPVTTFLHDRVATIPILSSTGEGFAAANLIIVAIMLGFSSFPFRNHTWSWQVVKGAAIIELLNGMMHLLPALAMGRYYSGCISGVALLILAVFLLVQVRKEYGKQSV